MQRVAIVSDTHVPSREPALPDWIRREVREADHTIHAGDFDTAAAYGEFRDLADGLTAVAGNNDPGSLGLPESAEVRIGGVTFAVTHYRSRRPSAGRGDGPGDTADASVFGHTHETYDSVVGGVRLLNPGSCTGAWPAFGETMMVATVDGGDLSVETLDGSGG